MDKDQEKQLRRKRRLEKEKKKKKAKKIYPESSNPERLADHLASCSCELCKTPRKSKLYKGKNKFTLQERRFLDTDTEYPPHGCEDCI